MTTYISCLLFVSDSDDDPFDLKCTQEASPELDGKAASTFESGTHSYIWNMASVL